MSTELVRSRSPEEEELARKLAELGELEVELADRELALATLLSGLHLFERRYLRIVGSLYAHLDELRAQIAELHSQQSPADEEIKKAAAEARARAQDSTDAASEAQGQPAADRFEPTDDLKKLYRGLAKMVHPDLVTDEQERVRRTRVMMEVNRAYEAGDEDQLRAIIRDWETSPEGVTGEGPGAELVRVIRKIFQIRNRLDAIEKDFDRVRGSPIHELKIRVEEAEVGGRDLLSDMAAAVELEIADATEELFKARAGTGAP